LNETKKIKRGGKKMEKTREELKEEFLNIEAERVKIMLHNELSKEQRKRHEELSERLSLVKKELFGEEFDPKKGAELVEEISESPSAGTKPSEEKKDDWMRVAKIAGVIGLVLILVLWAFWSVWISDRTEKDAKSAHFWREKWQKAADAEKASAQSARDELKKTQDELKNVQAELAALKEAQAKEPEEQKALAGIIKLATIKKGKGIEDGLYRQLFADPWAYGFDGDTNNKSAIKKWAQKKAHQVAILAGYTNYKTGEEVRVKGEGGNVAYVLTVDKDKISVEEYTVDQYTGNFNSEPEQINQLADSYDRAQFKGDMQDEGLIGLQAYEYIYKEG